MFKLLYITVLAIAGGALAACSPSAFARATPTRELSEHPADFVGKIVTVRGKVSGQMQIPLTDDLLYRIADSTGEVLVVSHGSEFPSSSREVVIRGRFNTVALFPGANGAVLPHITVGQPAADSLRRARAR